MATCWQSLPYSPPQPKRSAPIRVPAGIRVNPRAILPLHASRFPILSSVSRFTHHDLPAARFAGGDNAPKIKSTRRRTGLIVLKAADREPVVANVVEPGHSVDVVAQVPAPGARSTNLRGRPEVGVVAKIAEAPAGGAAARKGRKTTAIVGCLIVTYGSRCSISGPA